MLGLIRVQGLGLLSLVQPCTPICGNFPFRLPFPYILLNPKPLVRGGWVISLVLGLLSFVSASRPAWHGHGFRV